MPRVPMRSKGFTIIELVIVIVLIGLIASVVIPNLSGPTARAERAAFVADLNSLLYFGWQQALITGTIHLVDFDFSKKAIVLKIAEGFESGKPKSRQAKAEYRSTDMAWPERYELKNFFIEGVQQNANAFYFYIMPDGLAQDIIINFFDTKDVLADGSPRQVGLVLNPFSVRLREYDTFQK